MTECILGFLGSAVGRTGYRRVWRKSGSVMAHRLAWEDANQACLLPWAQGKVVIMHTCDNPRCINPKHLVVGDNLSNVEDKRVKGRSARGLRNGNSYVNQKKIEAVRAFDWAGTNLIKSSAAVIGMSQTHFRAVMNGRYRLDGEGGDE